MERGEPAQTDAGRGHSFDPRPGVSGMPPLHESPLEERPEAHNRGHINRWRMKTESFFQNNGTRRIGTWVTRLDDEKIK